MLLFRKFDELLKHNGIKNKVLHFQFATYSGNETICGNEA